MYILKFLIEKNPANINGEYNIFIIIIIIIISYKKCVSLVLF